MRGLRAWIGDYQNNLVSRVGWVIMATYIFTQEITQVRRIDRTIDNILEASNQHR